MYIRLSELKLMAKFSKTPWLVVRGSQAYLVTVIEKPRAFRAQVAVALEFSSKDMPDGIWCLDLPAFSMLNTEIVAVTTEYIRSGDAFCAEAVSVANTVIPSAILDNLTHAVQRTDFSDPYSTDTDYSEAVWKLIIKAAKAAKKRGFGNTFMRVFPEYLLYQDSDARLCIAVM